MNRYSGQARRTIKKQLAQEKQYVKYFFFYEDITSVMGGVTYDEETNKRLLFEAEQRIKKLENQLNETI